MGSSETATLFSSPVVSVGSVLFTGLMMFVNCVDGSSRQIESINTLLGQAICYGDPSFRLLECHHILPWSRGVPVPPTTSVNPSDGLEIRSENQQIFQ